MNMNKSLVKFSKYYAGMFAILLVLTLIGNSRAETTVVPGSAPVVTLRVWNESAEQEQYAFLAGFVSLFELEKEWQGQKGILPLKQSMIGSWGAGLNGMTLRDMRNTVDNYAARNPGESNKLVVEVLWHELVQPKLGSSVAVAGKDTSKRVTKTMKSQKQSRNTSLNAQ